MKQSEALEEAVIAVVNNSTSYDCDVLIDVLGCLFKLREDALWKEERDNADQ